jgi:ribonucleoside-diphosphate reductase alpha chain
MSIKINKDRDSLLAPYAVSMLKDFYLTEYETSPQEAYKRASIAWAKFGGELDVDLAQRLYNYVSNKWFMFASPVLSNAPNGSKQGKGMPISCFLTYVPDTLEGLISHTSELRWLSVYGGGVGGHWSDVRTVSDVAPGPMPFLHTVDADMIAYRQGKTRKGSYAAYMDVSHPDIIEFLNMRIPTGDVQRKALNLHNAVNLSDEFMQAVTDGAVWNLKDPKDGKVKESIDARKLWERIIETRFRTGEPYLNFIDTANAALPQPLKDLGLKINGSNLCNEIHLPTNADRTAVCCLSSLNLEYYDEWKDTSIVADLIRMLDNVLQYFIDNAPDTIPRAIYSASRERSIGLGSMGFHSLLQRHGVAWESETARQINHAVFQHINTQAVSETKKLAEERGEYPDGIGSGRRNSHLLAIAPNASSGVILSTSPSIEPNKANAYTHRTRAGSFLVKNKYLDELLTKKNENNDSIWQSIITRKGSVQHLPFLTEGEKAVFCTADELDQNWVVTHAAERQQFICQGQSVNLFFPSGADKSYVNQVHLRAWKEGLKGLYYLRTEAKQRAENVSEKVERVALEGDKRNVVYSKKDCPFCSMAKEELRLRGIPFDDIDLVSVGKTAAEVTGRKDIKTVPQVYIAGEYIGGYNELLAYLNTPVEQSDGEECVACSG